MIAKLLQMNDYELLSYLDKFLTKQGYKVQTDFDNYIYASGTLHVCLVAHIDTVGKVKPKTVLNVNGILSNLDGVLGADDRAGVYAIIELLESGLRPSVLFTNYEECGGKGVKQFLKDGFSLSHIKFFIEFDRQGVNEYVYYSDYIPEVLKKWVESFGFVENYGSYSDVADITNYTNIAHINLSVCYFNQHTSKETLNLNYLEVNIKTFKNMLLSLPKEKIETIKKAKRPFAKTKLALWTNYRGSYESSDLEDDYDSYLSLNGYDDDKDDDSTAHYCDNRLDEIYSAPIGYRRYA